MTLGRGTLQLSTTDKLQPGVQAKLCYHATRTAGVLEVLVMGSHSSETIALCAIWYAGMLKVCCPTID